VILRAVTIGVSLAGLPFIVSHVVEDFIHDAALVSPALLGGFLAVQMLGLVLVGSGQRVGWLLTLVTGLVWVVGAAIGHGPELVRGNFHSASSGVGVLGLIVSQAMAILLACLGWLRSRLSA